MYKVILFVLFLISLFGATACENDKSNTIHPEGAPLESTMSMDSNSPLGIVEAPNEASPALVTSTPEAPITNGDSSCCDEPIATPVVATTANSYVPESFLYNLPAAILNTATGLYASPNRGEFVVPAEIPAGQTVFVMGRNATNSHLRVVWNIGVGWVPVSFTNYSGQTNFLEALPVFKREPPACAVPLTTQFNLNSQWGSDRKQRIAVVIDLFRSQYGDFPLSYLSLTVNDNLVNETRRQIVENGQFSLKDVVFTLPGNLQVGDRVGYFLETLSDEPLAFLATIFSVPENCNWEVK